MSIENCELPSARALKLRAVLPDWLIVGALTVAEDIRAQFVHPAAGLDAMLKAGRNLSKPLLSPDSHPMTYAFLQHMGDFWEGFVYSAVIFHTLNIAFPNKLPERLKMAAALSITTSALLYAEGGIRPNSKPDIEDFLGGMAGVALWYGSRRLFRRLENIQEGGVELNHPEIAEQKLVIVNQVLKAKPRHKKRKKGH